MSSKRNHAVRSRKTHRWNMIAARNALRGSLPWKLLHPVASEPNEAEEEKKDESLCDSGIQQES